MSFLTYDELSGLGRRKSLSEMSEPEKRSFIDALKREMARSRKSKIARTSAAERQIRETHALITRSEVPVVAAPWGGGRLAWEEARGVPETQARIEARRRAEAKESGQPWTPWGPAPVPTARVKAVEARARRRMLLEARIKARGLQPVGVTMEAERAAHEAAARGRRPTVRTGLSRRKTIRTMQKAAVQGMRASPKYSGREATIGSREALVNSMRSAIGEEAFGVEMNRIVLHKARKRLGWSKAFETEAHHSRATWGRTPERAHLEWQRRQRRAISETAPVAAVAPPRPSVTAAPPRPRPRPPAPVSFPSLWATPAPRGYPTPGAITPGMLFDPAYMTAGQ